MEKKCILFTGLQASGKTTFYQQQFPDLVRVNLDTLHTRNKERLLLDECFAAGSSFVVDNTNPTSEVRAKYIEAARKHGYRVIGYYFQSSISACKERNSRRDRQRIASCFCTCSDTLHSGVTGLGRGI